MTFYDLVFWKNNSSRGRFNRFDFSDQYSIINWSYQFVSFEIGYWFDIFDCVNQVFESLTKLAFQAILPVLTPVWRVFCIYSAIHAHAETGIRYPDWFGFLVGRTVAKSHLKNMIAVYFNQKSSIGIYNPHTEGNLIAGIDTLFLDSLAMRLLIELP